VFTSENISRIPDFYDVTKPTALVFHGWMGSESSSFMRNVTTAYLSRVSGVVFVSLIYALNVEVGGYDVPG
jgi:predicted alpha/beta-fold hydrolase